MGWLSSFPTLIAVEAIFTGVLVGTFASMALIPFPNATSANIFAIVFLQLLGRGLGWLDAGAHLSPAVSVSLMCSGKLRPAECLYRLLGQLLGGPLLVLFASHYLAGRTAFSDFGVPVPAGAAPWIVFMECAATFCLLNLIFHSGHSLVPDVGGTIIGGVLCPMLKFAASMNPANSAFAALVSGQLGACACAIVGSLSAAVMFGLLERRASQSKLKQA
jgi:glycerol uptake facilitator-like aquaporin